MCMVDQRLANVASVLAWSMKRIWRGGPGASIYCGSYVTKLAESLGVFARYEARFMREGPVPCLKASSILTLIEPNGWEPVRLGPQVEPPLGTNAATAMQAGIPTRYQRPMTRAELPGRQYPLAQPRPDPFTLDSLYDRMEAGFGQLHGYMEEQYKMVRQLMDESRRSHEADQRRLEDGMRYMMENMNMGVPSYFQQSAQLSWDQVA
ncbi:hypothetical protein HanRHA438_Chr08g0360171 [Helianthus annuus]|uniref:Uncharacterized protein n=1 Tax=Helianthus annuus TaxID=4232 RepID=A0A9K3IGC7_HELAN|nr:uncharacterized protein LOC110873455 [Helianthus annuus]XP_021978085.1 uncharacterized protein LOC110873455 [Helianthus annuus]KAF5796137.1 hypothetical protein HanXRQr2_Chr08g0347881 [Helianthus annuus]KAJ0554246.1 hypothetical protein HanHA89_Chr08g0305511 [Helianthus annuus]KAJ0765463.1 hypothetical protein HanPI659440_Chr08g0303691 [Helianthus annuus]KAJ0898733.1 hypothetical protein HanRHA438_Chr08g0360171 [Helianthus annuus]KAJ0902366.1 hypothetical protein HanPSC8_Chr08g0336151 [Hel